MHDLQKTAKACMKDIETLGIKLGNITKIEFARLRNRAGYCMWYSDDTYEIQISSSLQSEKIDIRHLKDTICHELLHTCDIECDHGEPWITYAKMLEENYGYDILTLKTKEEIKREKPILCKLVCPKCGGRYNVREQNVWELICEGRKINCQWCKSDFITQS